MSLTSLGQNRLGKAKVRHKIKMVWRFLKNPRITESLPEIYSSLAKEILSGLNELIIAVDWSGCCGKENQHTYSYCIYYHADSLDDRLCCRKKYIHHDFQANTIRTSRVLSFVFLAKQMVIHGFKKLKIRKFQSILSLFQLEYNQMFALMQAELGVYKI